MPDLEAQHQELRRNIQRVQAEEAVLAEQEGIGGDDSMPRDEAIPQARQPPEPWPTIVKDAYHGLAGHIVHAIEPHSEADPVALLIQFLTAFGSVIGRGPHFTAEADYHALNLFAVLVGVTSKGRKGSAWGHVQRLFQPVADDWTGERIVSGLSSGEGLIWEVRDAIVKSGNVVDPGVQDKRLLVLEKEFASPLRAIGREGNTLSPTIRQAWESGDLRTLTKNNPARASGAHISIIGHITKDELRRYLNTTEVANGFANRFLWCCVKRSKVLPEGGRIHEVDFAPLVRRLREAVQFVQSVGEIRRDEEARAIWCTVYEELSAGRLGLLGAATSRAEAQVMRLACLYALLDMSYVVQREHLEAALALWEYCEASVHYIFGDTLGDPVADDLLRALRAQPDGLTRTQMRDLFGRNRKACEMDRALGVLLEHSLARPIREPTTGRPIERWVAVRGGTTKTTNTT